MAGRDRSTRRRTGALPRTRLEEAARDEHQVAHPGVTPAGRTPTGAVGRRQQWQGDTLDAHTVPAPLTPVEALRRQQRILHRSAVIDYVLAAETRGGGPLTMGDALAELLADVTEAARTIGILLQDVQRA